VETLANLTPEQKAALAQQLGRRELAKLARANAARQSLADFVRQGWEILEPGTPLTWNWHIDVICDALERVTRGETKKVLINIPPGMMKSLLVCVFWPAWTWLHRPDWRSVFCSYGQNLSDRDSQKCRQLIASKWYQDLILPDASGHKWEIDTKTDNVRKFANTATGFRMCTSVGGTGTGLRANAIIVDDAMNADEYPTTEALEKVKSWWKIRMSSRGAKMKDAVFVVIMQRLHDNDLAGFLIEEDKKHAANPAWRPYEKIILPNEFDPDDPARCPKDPRTERGELLHPGHFDADDTEIQKLTLGEYQYSAQYQQRPVPAGGGVFKVWRLKFWFDLTKCAGGVPPQPVTVPNGEGILVTCEQAPRPQETDFMTTAISFDCTFKETNTSDFVAGHVWGKTKPRRKDVDGAPAPGAFVTQSVARHGLYLLDAEYGRMGLTETVQRVRQLKARHPRAYAIYIEDKANGPAVIQILKSELHGVIEVNPRGGKESRAYSCQPFVDAGDVWLPHPSMIGFDWVANMIKELSAFPRGNHDDHVDAMTQCLMQLHEQDVGWLLALTRM